MNYTKKGMDNIWPSYVPTKSLQLLDRVGVQSSTKATETRGLEKEDSPHRRCCKFVVPHLMRTFINGFSFPMYLSDYSLRLPKTAFVNLCQGCGMSLSVFLRQTMFK